MFSLRIVNADHYLSPPKSGLDLTYSQFRGNEVKSVPIIRIFGSSPSGCKTCLHVHGVFPYILVPYNGAEDVGRIMYQLASSLDKAINVSLGTSYSTKQHVFKIAQVSGRPYYGYHGQDHQFLKIFFYNPLIVKRASDLLQNGAVCGTPFQIHESHVPFILQFFIDYNLYGMSFINIKSVVYRKNASPSGITHGTIPKESFCELEADAVAVDILNRLTVEGELAVNPGLAAIWREEKERLQKDCLDSSQRPTPQHTLSDILLKEKLKENLKLQGKCKIQLKETIPYPAETQRTTSEILDASVLDTHSVSSLVPFLRTQEETAVVDEELVLSLTQNSASFSSLDQSLLFALDSLAAPNEELGVAISQNVEDDSILGSQILPQENRCDDYICEEELAALDYSLPPDLPPDDHAILDNDEDSDENFEEKIPQLDGIGDVCRAKKKKAVYRKKKVLVKNVAVENNTTSDNEEISMENMKNGNCWPESGKQECLDEIFSDDEPFNSPIQQFEEDYFIDENLINIDVIHSFETVLRGDPSFTCSDVASEDVLFTSKNDPDFCNSLQALNINVPNEKKTLCSVQEEMLKPIIGNSFSNFIKEETGIKIDVNKYPCDNPVPSLNVNLGNADIDKPMSLPSCSEDLLNTSQLDEMFNEDLNKGLEIIYESNSQHDSGELYESDTQHDDGEVLGHVQTNNCGSDSSFYPYDTNDDEMNVTNENQVYTSGEVFSREMDFCLGSDDEEINNTLSEMIIQSFQEEKCKENFENYSFFSEESDGMYFNNQISLDAVNQPVSCIANSHSAVTPVKVKNHSVSSASKTSRRKLNRGAKKETKKINKPTPLSTVNNVCAADSLSKTLEIKVEKQHCHSSTTPRRKLNRGAKKETKKTTKPKSLSTVNNSCVADSLSKTLEIKVEKQHCHSSTTLRRKLNRGAKKETKKTTKPKSLSTVTNSFVADSLSKKQEIKIEKQHCHSSTTPRRKLNRGAKKETKKSNKPKFLSTVNNLCVADSLSKTLEIKVEKQHCHSSTTPRRKLNKGKKIENENCTKPESLSILNHSCVADSSSKTLEIKVEKQHCHLSTTPRRKLNIGKKIENENYTKPESLSILNHSCVADSSSKTLEIKVEKQHCHSSTTPRRKLNKGKKIENENYTKPECLSILNHSCVADSSSKTQEITVKVIPKSPNHVNCKKINLSMSLFKKKRKISSSKEYNSYKMSNSEVQTYFSQLNYVASQLADRNITSDPKPALWTPIRDMTVLVKKNRQTVRPKQSRLTKIMKTSKLSRQAMPKLTRCFVLLNKLSPEEVNFLCKVHKVNVKLDVFNKKKLDKKSINGCQLRLKKLVPESNQVKKTVQITKKSSKKKHKYQTDKKTDSSNETSDKLISSASPIKNNPHLNELESSVKNCNTAQSNKCGGEKIEDVKSASNTNYPVVLVCITVEDEALGNNKSAITNDLPATSLTSYIEKKTQLTNNKIPLSKIQESCKNLLPVVTLQADNIRVDGKSKSMKMHNHEISAEHFDQNISRSCIQNGVKNVESRMASSEDKTMYKNENFKVPHLNKSEKCNSLTPVVLLRDEVLINTTGKSKTEKKEQVIKSKRKSNKECRGRKKIMNLESEKVCLLKNESLLNNNDEILSSNKDDICCNLEPVMLESQCFITTTSVKENNFDGSNLESLKETNSLKQNVMPLVCLDKVIKPSLCDNIIGNNNLRVQSSSGLKTSAITKRVRSKVPDYVKSKRTKLKTDTIFQKNTSLKKSSFEETAHYSSSDENFNHRVSRDVVENASDQQRSCIKRKLHFVKNNQTQKPSHAAIMSPLVCLDKLSNISCYNKSIRNKKDQLKKSSFQKLSSDPTVNEKRILRIYSLDGTVDNSSSDENMDDRCEDATNSCNTPSKKRKSSSKANQSPKTNYVPLNIEIKKSPKVKTSHVAESKTLFSCDTIGSNSMQDELTVEAAPCDHQKRNIAQVPSMNRKPKSTEPNDKRRLEPFIQVQRIHLPSISSLSPSNFGDTIPNKEPSTSSAKIDLNLKVAAHPIVKKLEVSVRRLSCDIQGSNGEPSSLARLSRRSHRSASLPTTSKEKLSTRDNIDSKTNELPYGDNAEDNNCRGIKIKKFDSAGSSKRVRKVLIFPNEINAASKEGDQTDLISNEQLKKRIPSRKFSTDMFEINNTPENDPSVILQVVAGDLSEHMTPDDIRLSGITQNTLSDFGNTFCDSSIQSGSDLDSSQCHSKCKSLVLNDTLNFNLNAFGFNNPSVFTPAFDPPSRAEVLANLRDFGLPEVVNEEPFYSNPADVAKSCEVGNTMLKLLSKSVLHLEEFEGTFNCFSKWKKESLQRTYKKKLNLNAYRHVLNDNTVTITPLLNPPSSQQTKLWLKNRLLNKNKKEEAESNNIITKILLPSSPGRLPDNEKDDDTLTLSQCTLVSKTSVGEPLEGVCSKLSTPESASSKDIRISPLMASTPLNSEFKVSTYKRRFSKLSLTLQKSLRLIKEEEQTHHETTLHADNSDSQAASVTQVVKQMSETEIRKLLSESRSPASTSCQIDMATPNNSGNYRMELQNLQDVKLGHEHQYLTIMTVELHIHTRGELRPNPEHDAVCCLFYNITNDCPDLSISHITGAIYVNDGIREEKMPQFHCEIQAVPNEQSLIAAFISLVRKWDPDIFVGYEIEMLSWGYLLQRAYVLNVNLHAELSRLQVVSRPGDGPKEFTGNDYEIQLVGRIVLNLWRFLRHEVALLSYTFENLMYHVLHQRIPLFSFSTLTRWWAHRTKMYRWQVFEHYLTRVEGTVKLMQQVDLVGRTSEFARLFGIQFYEVLSRGSQFRVESMMLRLVKPLNYVAVSPSVQQRAKMRAPETLPLIMEPESRFYSDPVIVLDFQSLYPSIIIAYNYCYSTCLGRVEHLGRSELFEFGCTQLRVSIKELERLQDNLNFSPCGVAFVNQSVVKGVLPRMLEEILNTRLMVKQSMKENKDNKTLQRVLHARQLGLKLIANVTYGYTAANFSGRMSCIEVGDSVVSKARETLERAINLVGRNSQWGARVIYGDTDSMFVLVPGKSREEAFKIGAEIAEAVTNDNPKPVKLKLEKVYQPCLLQTKKRYVGYMYESPGQEKPVYDAKGIETVRRDGCPAVAKTLEKTLRLLFETKDVSLVKKYICRQLGKVLSGRISLQELTFAREYRGASGYRPGACVPALELSRQERAVDPRSEPRVGERVPYVIAAGPPGLPLIRLVRSPRTLLADDSLKINAEYYITRVIIPPLDRCLSLIGAQVSLWYSEMPRKQHLYLPFRAAESSRKATISQYFVTASCVVCGRVTTSGVCAQCQQKPQCLAVTLGNRVRVWQRKLDLVNKLCESCCGRPHETDCTSLDCPVLYRRNQATKDHQQADYVRNLQQQYLMF